MEWVTNVDREVRAVATAGESHAEAMARERAWRARFVQGDPKGTDTHSVEDLRRMGMVGLYRAASEPLAHIGGDVKRALAAYGGRGEPLPGGAVLWWHPGSLDEAEREG